MDAHRHSPPAAPVAAPAPPAPPGNGFWIALSGLAVAALLLAAHLLQQRDAFGLVLTLLAASLALAATLAARRRLRRLDERCTALEAQATQLRAARRDAEAASEAKSVFLTHMGHDIRAPFHALMGTLSLLRETGLDARQVDLLRSGTESAEQLLAVLNDLLDMSQLESGRLKLSPAPVDLRALLREVEAQMRPRALAKSLALHLDTDPAVPERVLADATRVRQILVNLLGNAIKFTARGTVVLDLRVDAVGNAPQLEFAVSDTGAGIDASRLAGLFDRLAPATGSAPAKGTGLGLEISRRLARLMGGDIGVRSQPGQGSRFAFCMPLLAAPQAGTAPASDAAPGAARLQVLVAEDHPVNREYMAALLDSLGHDAYFSADGEQAVQVLQHPPHGRRFDIVLMDLHMPVLDGIGATRAIRALPDPALSTVPIVALTADGFADTRDRCLVAGMNDFLTKPVNPHKLATSLRRLFGADTGAEPQRAAAPEPAPAPAGAPALLDPGALATALQAMPSERLAAMVHDFLDQGPQTVQRLRAAMRDAQPLALRVNAHAARGVALNLGLSALAATAEALHEGAAHLPAHEIARLVQRFEDLLAPTRQAVLDAGLLRRPAADAVAATR